VGNRDPAVYGDDAESFNPERFLDEHGRLIPGPQETHDEGHSSHGFASGRRTCVGKHVVNDSLFINMATVLWALRLEGSRDESGMEVPLDTDSSVDTGLVLYVAVSILSAWMVPTLMRRSSRPVPYTLNVFPRFLRHRHYLRTKSSY
jgi:Cytochrome P450